MLGALSPLIAFSTLALGLGAGGGGGAVTDPPASVAVEVVNLTYVPSKVRPTGDEASSAAAPTAPGATPAPDAVDDLVAALNAMFPAPPSPAAAGAAGAAGGSTAPLASFVETTRPAPFGKDLLDLAFGNDTSTGTGRILAALPQGKAALLAGALLSETPPTFSKVAPGIAVHVRPTVLPDGSAARLTIDARFGVTTADYDPKDQARTDVRMQPPPPGIASHHVSTDAAVSAFDLFDISSFTVDTAVPQAPFVVPLLGRLPILGRMFQFRRDNVTTRHESLILVNTAILPRSLALLSYYQAGRPTSSPEVSGAHSTAPPAPH